MSQQLDSVSCTLLHLGGLIQTSIASYVAARHSLPDERETDLPSKALFDAQRALLSGAGMLTELVSEPRARLLEVGLQYFEARALHIVVDKRVSDLLHGHGEGGVHIKELSAHVGIESGKLSRILRCLCSVHIFKEVDEDVFANNSISAALAGNESLRANILFPALDIYSSSDYLPRYLSDPTKGHSYAAEVTPWQDAVGTNLSRWDWLEEKVKLDDLRKAWNASNEVVSAYPGPFGDELKKVTEGVDGETLITRPEHAIFGLAMVETGKVLGRAHLYDFPWASLGNATIVDVGGGVGSFSLQLSHEYQDLKFVVQDRAAVLKQAETDVWPRENKLALEAGRVRFMPHNFFEPNPIKDGDVYWLRHVLHNWSDEYCVRILAAIKQAMNSHSRILICDQVMNTTRGSPDLIKAPVPLPANWGYYTRYSHQRDLAMMSTLNGIERKPAEFADIVKRAGLRINRIWDCRSLVGLIEVVLPDSKLA